LAHASDRLAGSDTKSEGDVTLSYSDLRPRIHRMLRLSCCFLKFENLILFLLHSLSLKT